MTEIESKVMEIYSKYIIDGKIHHGQVVARLCPFCHGGDHNDVGTFAIGLYNGAYNCKRGSCGAKGTLKELCNFFGERCNIDPDYGDSVLTVRSTQKKYTLPDPSDILPLTDDAIKYFANRSITKETLEHFGVSCNHDGNIVFPFYRNGTLTYTKFRRPQRYVKGCKFPKEWAGANEESILFGMDLINPNEPLYITEGMLDCMAMYEAGITNVVSVPSGCQNTDWIFNCYTWLEGFHEIIMFGDSDAPGREMIDLVAKRLGEERCLFPPEYPNKLKKNENGEWIETDEMCKDANEILYYYGKEKLCEIANSCKSVPITGLLDLADVQFIDPTSLDRIYTRIPRLDEMIAGLAEGTMTVFTGKRGSGKSTLNGNLLLNAVQQGHKVCAYSGELSAQKFLEWIMLQATPEEYITVVQHKDTHKLFPVVPPEIQTRIRQWIRGNFFLFDNAAVLNGKQTEAILKIFELAAKKFGCDVFLVD